MKKSLAILLALVLMLSLVPAALADEATTTTSTTTSTGTTTGDATTTTTTDTTTDGTVTTTSDTTTGDTSTIPPVTDSTTPTAQPGTFAYTLSQLIERIRVLLTPDLAAKAELLTSQAQLRIAELEQLQPTQTELAQQLTQAYIDRLQHAVTYMVRAQAKGKNIDKAEARLLEAAEGGKVIAEALEGQLSDEELGELEDEADKAALNAACIANVTPEIVAALREKGFGYGEIALINMLATKSGKTTDEVATLFAEKGFGETATELGLSVADMRKNAHGIAETIEAMDPEQVTELRHEGFSYGKIATMQMMAEVSGKPIADVNALVDSKGLGQAVKELGVPMKELRAKAKEAREEARNGGDGTAPTDPTTPTNTTAPSDQTTDTTVTQSTTGTTQPTTTGQSSGEQTQGKGSGKGKGKGTK